MLKDQKLSYTLEAAITQTGFTRSRIFAAINSGELRTFKAGRRRMVSHQALEAFIAKLERESAERGAA